MSTRTGWIALVLVLAVGCWPAADAEDPPPPAPAARLVDRPCDVTVDGSARCYWLDVPERRDVEGSRRIRLWVAVLTPDGAAGAVPLLPLSGGPGNGASTAWVRGSAELGRRPVVVVDQRGTGRSEPRLGCEHPRAVDDVRLDWSDRVRRLRDAAGACRTALVAEGVDLDGYDTVESAADLVDLRRLLDVEAWDVVGVSYGGRLARELVRQDPDGVRSLHLDSPMPLSPYGPSRLVADADDQVSRLGAGYAADLEAAYQRLEAGPVRRSGITFDGDQFVAAMRLASYATELVPVVRQGVAAVARGDLAFLGTLAAVLPEPAADDPDSLAFGTFATVTCADDGARLGLRDAYALAAARRWSSALAVWPWLSCDLWDVDPVELEAVEADVPTLVTVGELDILDPDLVASDVRRSLPEATVVEVPGGAHIVGQASPCVQRIVQAFRAHPNARVDTTCLRVR